METIGNTYFICFQMNVDHQSINLLLDTIENRIPDECQNVILLLNSHGGSVRLAMGAYHLFRSLPCQITAYNIGAVDSAALLLYLGASRRYCVANARFLVHPVFQIHQNEPQTIQSLKNKLEEIQLDTIAVANILEEHTKLSSKRWLQMMKTQSYITPENAIAVGLVEGIDTIPLITSAQIFFIGA